jgi:hypothetical protein
MKKALLLLALVCSSAIAQTTSYSLVSSNQFKTGTNGIYAASLANLTTLSNAVNSSIYVSSNSLTTTSWTNLSAFTGKYDSLSATNSLIVGAGSPIIKILSATGNLDFPSTVTNQISSLNLTVTGAGTNGVAIVNILTPDTNFLYSVYISATNTATVRAANISTNTVDPAITGARVTVFQY